MTDSSLSRRTILAGMAASAAVMSLPARAGDPDVLTIASPYPEKTPMGTALGRWKGAVTGRNEGRFNLKVAEGDAVGGQSAVVDGVLKGKFSGAMVSTYGLRNAVPRLTTLDLPYLFGNGEQGLVEARLKGARPMIAEALETNGLKLIWMFYMGRQVIVSQDIVLGTPDRYNKVRIGSRPGSQGPATWAALGAASVPTPIGEMAAALRGKQIDGAALNFFEAADIPWGGPNRTLSLTYHSVDVGFLVMNAELFNKLSGKNQEALVQDRVKQQEAISNHIRKRESALMGEIKANGFKLHPMTDIQVEQTAQHTKKVHDDWIGGHGGAKGLYQALRGK